MKQHTSTNKLVKITLPLVSLILCLAACSSESGNQAAPTQAPDADPVYQPAAGSITANGVLLPARQVTLSFDVGGTVESVDVAVGEHVEAGQVLATLNDVELERAVARAELELQTAQTRLAQLEADAAPLTERVLAATAAISSAQAALAQAHAQAEQRANYAIIDGYALEQAEQALQDAQNEYQKVLDDPRTHDWAPTSDEAQILEDMRDYYEVVLAQYRLHAADRGYEAAIAQAEAQLAQAQLTLYEAQHPIASEAPALAQLDIERAQMALEAAQTDLAHAAVIAPFDSVVSEVAVSVDEWATPGTPAIELLDVSRWRVETKNVGELQIARVREGQEAIVRVNAFQEETLQGHVLTISPVAVVQQGDTTYTLTIELEGTDLNLRPGMTARVEILTE